MTSRRSLGRVVLPSLFLGAGVLGPLAAASFVRQLTGTVVHGDLYGVRIDRGVFQFMHDRHYALGGVRGSARSQAIVPWNEPDAEWDSITKLGAAGPDPTRLRVILNAWPPFARPAEASIETLITMPTRDADGTIRVRTLRMGRAITFIGAPLWPLLAGLFVAAAFIVAVRRRQRRAAAPGACPACGYDLRASPDRCPECGRPHAATSTTG